MSDDLTTIDLFAIHHDSDLLHTLHKLQRERCDERAITAGERPSGMRLSIADPVRRVKAALDPFWIPPFDDGVGARGHLLEDYLEVALFHGEYAPLSGKRYASQVAINWHRVGRSAFDWIVQEVEGSDLDVSCKTSIKSDKPSRSNIEQDARMLALAGYPAGSPFEIFVINPSTFRAVGPYRYALTQDQIDAARRELDGVTRAYGYLSKQDDLSRCDVWNDPAQWLDHYGLESNSGAFRLPSLDASGAVESRVRAERRAADALRRAKAEHEAASDLLFKHVDEQLAANPEAKSIVAYGADDIVTYGRKSNGAKQITVRAAEPATA